MAQRIPPEPITCGRVNGLPAHVWRPTARPGDRCDCGASILPDHPIPLAIVIAALLQEMR